MQLKVRIKKEELENDPELKTFADFVDFVDMAPHLDPMDSFFGRRTNALHLHYEIQEAEETIQYNDNLSLCICE